MTKLNLETFEIITAITTTYQEDIESWLLKEDGEILPLESITDLLDAYEYETDIFYFEVSNVENLGLEYLQIEKEF